MGDNILDEEGACQTDSVLNCDPELHGGTQDTVNINDEPSIGMEFPTDESAYEFYNRYASRVGFSIRRNSLQKSNGIIMRRQFCCTKHGQKYERPGATFRRANYKTNCPATMWIKLHTNGNMIVHKFEAHHNHELLTPSKAGMLRSQRGTSDAQKEEMDISDSSGMKPEEMMEPISRQVEGHENLGSQSTDYKNYLKTKRMREMERGDAAAVLKYLTKKQAENSSFFYSFQLDEEDQLTNVFWADAKSITDYGCFGDVVCFDTTYRINSYGKPFAPFVGVNHHKQTIIFGAALLYDETTESFKWLFRTFLTAMGGKQPVTILTDQCAAMEKAIACVLPDTCHRICVWHIFQDAAKHLSDIFQSSRSFQLDFSRCVYDYEDEEEFLSAWHEMLHTYELTENEWLKDLFQLKEKWALVYGRDIFCGDMRNAQRSESMHHVLKRYLNSQLNILHFFECYERMVIDFRYKEATADFKMRQTTPIVFPNVMMLKEASKVYTPEIFEMFLQEYHQFLNLEIFKVGEEGSLSQFQVSCKGKRRKHLVKYDSFNIKVICSCKKFEFVGVLCGHALKVLDFHNIKEIPLQYILKRWHRDAKLGFVTNDKELGIDGDPKEVSGKRHSALRRRLIKLATVASEHEHTFNLAQNYCDRFELEVMKWAGSVGSPSVHR